MRLFTHPQHTQSIEWGSNWQKVQNGVDQYIQGLRLNGLLSIKGWDLDEVIRFFQNKYKWKNKGC